MRYYSLFLLTCEFLYGQPRELTVAKSGGGIYRVKNNYSSAATAWILQCHDADGTRWYWNDQELWLEPKPIEPGKEIEAKILTGPGPFGKTGSQCENFQVMAAVFADRTVTGNLKWVEGVAEERRRVSQEIDKAKGILTKAVAEKTEIAAVQKEFEEWAASEARTPQLARPSATFSPATGWGPSTEPPKRPILKPEAPCGTLWMLVEEKKSLAQAVEALSDWSARLGGLGAASDGGSVPSTPLRVGSKPAVRPGFGPPPGFIGNPAPGFTLQDVDGQEVSLKSFQGKTVLLSFWATWCDPCREELPKVKEVYDEFKDQDLVVVAVNVKEPAGNARKYFEEQKYPFVNLLDTKGEVSEKYGAGGIPRTVLVDKNGVVRAFHRGYGPGLDLREMVKMGME